MKKYKTQMKVVSSYFFLFVYARFTNQVCSVVYFKFHPLVWLKLIYRDFSHKEGSEHQISRMPRQSKLKMIFFFLGALLKFEKPPWLIFNHTRVWRTNFDFFNVLYQKF